MAAAGDTYHSFYDRVPLPKRAPFTWPNNAPVAVAVLVSAEYYEMQPPDDAFIPPNVPGGFGRGPYPDFRVYTARAYGNRVGIFRLFEALDRHGMAATVAIDALTARYCPAVAEQALKSGYEIVGHGQSVTRVISAHMNEDEEREYILASLDTIEAACGKRPLGWHSPEYGESARTPTLLAELGVQYLLDWPNDEQPYTMTTAAGTITSVPVAVDCDDVFSHFHRRITMSRWVSCVTEALDRLPLTDAARDVCLCSMFILGSWGIRFASAISRSCCGTWRARKDVWIATSGAIAEWWKNQPASISPR